MQPPFDINCDLGENEPAARTRALMRWITSANIACGGHAGSAQSMRRTVERARRHRVHIGAHPGLWARADFGRNEAAATLASEDLELLLLHQVGALARILAAARLPLHHIKLHGALYHAVEASPVLARAYLRAVKRDWPHAIIYARAGGNVVALARRSGFGVRVWPEAFLDRAYADDGSLAPRTSPGAVVCAVAMIRSRLRSLLAAGSVESRGGKLIHLNPRTLCVHADTPSALRIAQLARTALKCDG